MTGELQMPGAVAVEGLEYVLPALRIHTSEIETEIAGPMRRLGFPRGTLKRLTGIEERRFWDIGVQPSEAATLAARKVIEKTGVDPERIGCIINTSVSKDYIEPSIASIVHGNLGLSPYCRNFDIGNACLGFIEAITTLEMMIKVGQIDYGLIVNGESAREPVEGTIEKLKRPEATRDDFRLRFANFTLGSGAVAMLLTSEKNSRSGHLVNGSFSYARTINRGLCVGQRDGGVVDPAALLREGVKLAADAWPLAVENIPNWSLSTIDLFIPHQVSKVNTRAISMKLNIPLRKMHLTYQELGNTGPASIPITLKMAEEAGRVSSGDQIGLLGISSGLNCTAMRLSW